MKKAILSVFGAFLSLVCGIVSLKAFMRTGEPLTAILAVIFAFGVICAFVGYIEDTEIADHLSNLFGGKEDDNE